MTQSFLIIGDTNVARRVKMSLQHRGMDVDKLVAPTDDELRMALHRRPAGVAVLAHNDVIALRYALATAHINGEIPVVVTIFDRTVANQLDLMLPQCITTSPAELAAPTLAGPCSARDILAACVDGDNVNAVVKRGDEIERKSVALRRSLWRMRWSHLTGLARSPDQGTQMLVIGLAGLLAILALDWAWLTFAEHHDPVAAVVQAVRVVATVGPATDMHGAHAVAASLAMLLTILLTAMFTAGFVDRLLSPRLTALVGPRVPPRAGHVIVIGLGQVGVRLCRELASMGIDVVGVERDPGAENLRLMRQLRVPVVIGHGEDRGLLERLRAHRARAIAAVGSDDLDNIAVALAAHAVAPDVRLVLRAGEHEAIAESRSLLPLGIVRDVASLSAAYVVSQLLGEKPRSVIADGADIYLEYQPGQFIAVHENACTASEHSVANIRRQPDRMCRSSELGRSR
jgi:TrkA-N domain